MFFKRLLADVRVIKIGFAVANDISKINATFQLSGPASSVLDLHTVGVFDVV